MQETQKMKFYYFLIYFALFAGAVLNGVYGLRYITGSVYDFGASNAATVYGIYPALEYADKVYGVYLLCYAFAAVYIRQEMTAFERTAPRDYLILLVCNTVVPLLYIGACYAVSHYYNESIITFDSLVSILSQTGLQIVMILCCKVYFKKRQYLFVNEKGGL